MSKYGLDKFYTKSEVVDKILNEINLSSYDLIIEPSAGNGAFSKKIKGCLSYDILPDDESIIQQNFLELDTSSFKGKVLSIGNPPFGKNGSLALSFIRKCSEFSSTIAFILPKSFKKESFYNKIPLNFHLVKSFDLENNSFLFEKKEVDIPCVFQIYEKKTVLREKTKMRIPTNFKFVKKEEANISVRRVGVYAGKAFLDTNKSKQSHYFIYAENPIDFLDKANSVEWEYNNTVGARSISKNELVEAIENYGLTKN